MSCGGCGGGGGGGGCAGEVDVDIHVGNDGRSGAACDIDIGMAIEDEELPPPLSLACIRPPSIPPISPPV